MKISAIEGKVFGAVVEDVDLKQLDDTAFAQIHHAFLEHGFLLFPAQFLSDTENIQFGERFGELEFGALAIANQRKHSDGSYSDVLDLESQIMRTNVGNETWHTDSTYQPVSSKCAMLSAVTVPDEGGETELADMRHAYACLPTDMRDRIASLGAYHSTQFSQANDLGDFPPADNRIYHGEAYYRPLVKVHAETGKPALFIGRHAFAVNGLSRSESRELLTSLLEFAVNDERRVYQHKWTKGDTLVWDNRCLLHRARPYDYRAPRVLTATRVRGDVPHELSYYPEDAEAEAGRVALSEELNLLRNETADKMYGATTAATKS